MSDCSSWGVGPGFVPPPLLWKEDKGKHKETLVCTEEHPGHLLATGPSDQPPMSYWGLSDISRGILGDEVPYKDPNVFFVPQSPGGSTPSVTVPGPNLPNPLRGMATGGFYRGSSKSVSQAKRPTHLSASMRAKLPKVVEVDEESFHSRFPNRDPLLHMRAERTLGSSSQYRHDPPLQSSASYPPPSSPAGARERSEMNTPSRVEGRGPERTMVALQTVAMRTIEVVVLETVWREVSISLGELAGPEDLLPDILVLPTEEEEETEEVEMAAVAAVTMGVMG